MDDDDLDLDLEGELERELLAEEEGRDASGSAQVLEGGSAQELGPAVAGEAQHAEPPGGDVSGMAGRAAPEADSLEDRKKERQRRNQEVLKLLTEDQLDRYEAFRRSSLSKTSMKRLLHNATGHPPNPNTTIVMCGITKLFVGDLVETAREIAAEAGERGTLRPVHVQKAYQKLDQEGKIPHQGQKRVRRLRL